MGRVKRKSAGHHVCRNSVEETWGIKIRPIPDDFDAYAAGSRCYGDKRPAAGGVAPQFTTGIGLLHPAE
jgi:hypothetical protein